jgi:acyl carrier protein
MTDRTIVSQIIQALADYLKQDAARITEEHHLRDDLGLDSMAVIELLYKIEETFNIQIPDQDLAAMSTVGSVALYVEGRLTPVKSATPRSTRSTPKSKGKKKKG